MFDVLLLLCYFFFFFYKQKTAYEMRISDWSSDVCSSDLTERAVQRADVVVPHPVEVAHGLLRRDERPDEVAVGAGLLVGHSFTSCWKAWSTSVRHTNEPR